MTVLLMGTRGCFLEENSLKSRLERLTVAVIFFHHKHLVS